MRGVGIRGIGALVAAAIAASCGWPEFAFEPVSSADEEGGAAGAGEPSGGSSGASGGAEPSGGTSGKGGAGGSGNPDPCTNGKRDGSETGIDCGGGTCPGCPSGSSCDEPSDCANERCTTKGVCELASCIDGVTSGEETDTDCGGPDCDERCATGDECVDGTDCSTGLCTVEGRCTSSSCDPVSGPCSTSCPCANGQHCGLNAECASGNCASGACAEGPRVLSRNDEPGAAFGPTPAILQTFVVQNDAPSALPLGELTLRYYFTSDALGAPTARCDESRAASSDACLDVETHVFGLSPATPFADAFVEVGFLEGAELGPGAGTSETPIAIEPPVGSLYDQRDDYSFAEGSTLAANSRVSLYRKGVLLWGREP